MTILTKPFSEKKGDKAIAPLVLDENNTPPTSAEDVEAQRRLPRILIFPAGVGSHRVTTTTTLCLLLTALTVVGIGIVGGKILYDQYLKVTHKSYEFDESRFAGLAHIPLRNAYDDNDMVDSDNEADSLIDKLFPKSNNPNWNDDDDFRKLDFADSFQEHFEINKDEKFEKIDVPNFREGQSGRFIHDFNTNITGIIDQTHGRCFVMPLNRQNILPPKSLLDLIRKMWEGHYKVNTELVRKTMRVVLPPISDRKSVGGYIAHECSGLPIYRLEKYVGGVVKRSAEYRSDAKFSQFAGSGITQVDITNLDEVIAYEKGLLSH